MGEGQAEVMGLKPTPNEISQNNRCTTPVNMLNGVLLKDLKPETIPKDTILWVTTISDACAISSIMLCVEDAKKNVTQLFLYNQMSHKSTYLEINEKFPKGTLIGIKNPYLSISFSGYLSLRNDNPENIILREKSKVQKALALKK